MPEQLLIDFLDSKIIPWTAERVEPRLVITGPTASKADLPEGVRVTRKELCGPRIAAKGRRSYVSGRKARWPADGLVETSDGPFIVCVIGGRVDFQVGEMVVHCGEGHFILVPSALLPHDDGWRPHYTLDPQDPSPDDFCDLFWLQRCARGIKCWTCHSRGAKHGDIRGQQCLVLNEAIDQLLELLMEEAKTGRDGWQTICQDYLRATLRLLRREIVEDRVINRDLKEHPHTSESLRQDPIERAQHYIRKHLKDSPTIDETAHYVFMSRTRFTEAFRQRTGQSYAEFLTECRLQQAKTMLLESSWSVTRIGKAVGLKSLPHFCQVFKRRFGLTPQEFRKKNGELV